MATIRTLIRRRASPHRFDRTGAPAAHPMRSRPARAQQRDHAVMLWGIMLARSRNRRARWTRPVMASPAFWRLYCRDRTEQDPVPRDVLSDWSRVCAGLARRLATVRGDRRQDLVGRCSGDPLVRAVATIDLGRHGGYPMSRAARVAAMQEPPLRAADCWP